MIFLLISGNETTRHLIASLLTGVATDAVLWAALRSDRTLVERAVEETLRLQPPIHVLLRNVERDTDDVRAADVPRREDRFRYGFRQPRRVVFFEAPEHFRLDRENYRDHLAFGGGPHVCPGSALARLEARVALETVLDELQAMTVEPGWHYRKVPVFWANGPVDLPVRVVAA